MKKFLRKTVLLLLLVILCISATLLGMGYFRYKREVEALPVREAVSAYTDREDFIPFEKIDEDFVHAVISVEDKRFFERKGYDWIALIRALYHNFLAREFVEGGSTISEQIAKNLYLGGYVTGVEDKMCEIFFLYDLEETYSKEELFALYANMNYYGDGYWGIERASQGYFGVSCSDLDLAEASILAGIPNAPAAYQLSTGYDLAKERQEWVLSTMVRSGYITEEEAEKAFKEELPLQ